MNTHKLWVCVNNLRNALAGKCLLAESLLDIVQDLRVCGVVLVQNVLELKIRGTETIAEVLCKHPAAV